MTKDKNTISLKPPIPEFQFNKQVQKLEELLHQHNKKEIADEKSDHLYYAHFLEEHFSELIYNDLGICGGAYILADKASNQLISIYNKAIQERLINTYPQIPFVQIPYVSYKHDKVNYPSTDRLKEASKYKNVLDAMFIGARDRQILYHKEIPSPEFYLHLPHNRGEEATQKLLPFERYLSQDGFEVIYCTVGEVLFYLYAWRYLVRLAQLRGIDGELSEEDSYLDYATNKKAEECDFWAMVENKKVLGLPEFDWENLLKDKKESWNKLNIKETWEELKKEIDNQPFKSEIGYTFDDEYKLMGLIDDKEIMTREFLALLRYTIHIAEEHLGWQAYHMEQYHLPITRIESGNNQITSDAHALSNLYIAERRLDIYMEAPDNPHQGYYPRLEKLQYDYSIDECINRVIRKYLLSNISRSTQKAPITQLLSKLHQKARFPILPYFYELAASDIHLPKEHLVFCVWQIGQDNAFKIRINDEDRQETAVTFSLLTLKPIWRVHPNTDFIKGGKSTHYMHKLSEAAYNRLYRIYTFFRFLARPVIDSGFYYGLINKSNERTYFHDYISAFSHEISKITDNIFEKSNIKINALFKSNLEALERMHKTLIDGNQFQFEEIKNWRIIPHPDIFGTWASLLRVWSGRRGNQLFDLSERATLREVMEECNKLSLRSHVGALFLSEEKYETLDEIIEYKEKFDRWIREEGGKKRMDFFDESTIRCMEKQRMADGGSDDIISFQNTFLRLLLATLTNIYEHSHGNFFLRVRVLRNLVNETSLEFIFVNPYDKSKRQTKAKSLGTEPVIKSCLQYLKSDLIEFNFGDFEDDGLGRKSKKWWLESVFEGLDTTNLDLWETRFRIPLDNDNIFENNTSIRTYNSTPS